MSPEPPCHTPRASTEKTTPKYRPVIASLCALQLPTVVRQRASVHAMFALFFHSTTLLKQKQQLAKKKLCDDEILLTARKKNKLWMRGENKPVVCKSSTLFLDTTRSVYEPSGEQYETKLQLSLELPFNWFRRPHSMSATLLLLIHACNQYCPSNR